MTDDTFLDDDATSWADRRGALLDALTESHADDAAERRRSARLDWDEAWGEDAP